MESSHSAHDAAPRLVVVSHALSEAQEAYQEARELRASTTSGQYFYKDATPRAEHYMMCTVELVGYPHRRAVPLKLSLCFDDGTLVPYEDQACLRLLKENVHVRPIISAETQVASFTYRIEIGSFRRADRSFVIRIDAEPTMVRAPPAWSARSFALPVARFSTCCVREFFKGGGTCRRARDARSTRLVFDAARRRVGRRRS
ncbi:hypothetical protein M885DRAFT_207867 [Pelagophyceae sp. CCMP2097]|nr:hypothetical protein M885DRAFT_207867 [Pelagophyceae sp. CCMP2097]